MEPVDVDVDVDDKAEWSTRNDVIFIRILHDHVKKGDLQTSIFHKRVWSQIVDEVFQQTKKRFTVLQLKSKFNRFRTKHHVFSDLISHTGFGWDHISNTVTASEVVWAEYIKRVPSVKPYRKKGLEHYEILGDIFNTTTATRQLSFSSSQVLLPSDEDREVKDNFINSEVHVNVDAEIGDDDDDDNVDQTEVSNKKKRKEKGLVDQLVLPATVVRINGRAWILILILQKKLCRQDWIKLGSKVVQSPTPKVVNSFLSLNVNMNNDNQSNSSESELDLEIEQLELEALELVSTLRRAEYYQYVDKMPCYTGGLTGYAFVQELPNGHPDRMYNMFHMDAAIFLNLCQTLEQSQLLEDDRHVTIFEAMAICLYILSHGAVMRVVAERF
ncbi:hypothetical protein LWI29_034424 [Acer saccharum]|uniref:Myb/SANT-like domain-containing protein n=1 Tax=Acer saccharum TaxID=4024 RepID=A0AA39RJG8_ACESA|nr:hypothetical protein LWI29_034424 [Acer saccharum]